MATAPKRHRESAGEIEAALDAGRRATRGSAPSPNGTQGLLAVQRTAGNAAAAALVKARLRQPQQEQSTRVEEALREVQRDDPDIDTVERGLITARDLGVPVALEGPKPPAKALEVETTGFGPNAIPHKPTKESPKPVPTESPLGKAGKKAAPPPVKGKGGRGGARPGGRKGEDGGPSQGSEEGLVLAEPQPSPDATPAPAGDAPPPVPPPGTGPREDPAFAAVTGSVGDAASTAAAHPPAKAKAAEAQEASVPPAADEQAQAEAAKIDDMDAQKPGAFDKKAFIAAVKQAIEAKSPKTLEEADEYASSGKAGEVAGDVKSLAAGGAQEQAEDIDEATAAAPDASKAVPKSVTPMTSERAPGVAPVAGAGAAPKPAPPDQLNLEHGRQQTDRALADEGITEPQLRRSNEPSFNQAVDEKRAADEHATAGPAAFREEEAQALEQHQEEADALTGDAVAGMEGAKGAAVGRLVAGKAAGKSKDETRRNEVTAEIQRIFTAAETDVRAILDGIDPKVEAAFEKGEKVARRKFEQYVAAKMRAYKQDRYSGWLGGLRWAKDKIAGMPSKVDRFYEAGRELYLEEMDGVISKVADIVGDQLSAAKKRIAEGRAKVKEYVQGLPKDLKKVGAEAAIEIGDGFAQLEADVEDKQSAVVDALASKYVEARSSLDARIEELQAENRGLVDKAIGAIKAVVGTIKELAAMLRSALARAASVVTDIIADPIGFLGNFVKGIKQGVLNFKNRVADHLRKGLFEWLFGALAEAGIDLPESFDLKGIIGFLAKLFGLTWQNIRGRLVKRIGEKAMAAVESGVDLFNRMRGGIGALWEMIVEKVGDLKEKILAQVQDFVVTRIIKSGITWIIGLLNPAAAFVKACKMIYDVVMFFVNNKDRIKELVNTILDSVSEVVRGGVSSVANKIESVLAQMVPTLISFLASLIGLGGIGQRIRKIVERVRRPFTRAIDGIIDRGLKLAAPIIRGLKGVSGRVKARVAAGKAWAKGKIDKGKAKLAEKAYGGTPDERESRGLQAGLKALSGYSGRAVGRSVLSAKLRAVRLRRGLDELSLTPVDGSWKLRAAVQRSKSADTGVLAPASGLPTESDEGLSDLQKKLESQTVRQEIDFGSKTQGRPDVKSGHVDPDGDRLTMPHVRKGEERGVNLPSIPGLEPGDEKGHLIAWRFYGPENVENLVPMAPSLNNGLYKRFEGMIAKAYWKLRDGNRPAILHLVAKPTYPTKGNAHRPVMVELTGRLTTLRDDENQTVVELPAIGSGPLSNPFPNAKTNLFNASETTLRAVLGPVTRHPRVNDVIEACLESDDYDQLMINLMARRGRNPRKAKEKDKDAIMEDTILPVLLPRTDRIVPHPSTIGPDE